MKWIPVIMREDFLVHLDLSSTSLLTIGRQKYKLAVHLWLNFVHFIQSIQFNLLIWFQKFLKSLNWTKIDLFWQCFSWKYFLGDWIPSFLENSYWECEENVRIIPRSLRHVPHNVSGIPATLSPTMWQECKSKRRGLMSTRIYMQG